MYNLYLLNRSKCNSLRFVFILHSKHKATRLQSLQTWKFTWEDLSCKILEFSKRFYLKQLSVISSPACPYTFFPCVCLLQTSCLQQLSWWWVVITSVLLHLLSIKLSTCVSALWALICSLPHDEDYREKLVLKTWLWRLLCGLLISNTLHSPCYVFPLLLPESSLKHLWMMLLFI